MVLAAAVGRFQGEQPLPAGREVRACCPGLLPESGGDELGGEGPAVGAGCRRHVRSQGCAGKWLNRWVPDLVPNTGAGTRLPGVDLSPWGQPWCKRLRRSSGMSCTPSPQQRWDEPRCQHLRTRAGVISGAKSSRMSVGFNHSENSQGQNSGIICCAKSPGCKPPRTSAGAADTSHPPACPFVPSPPCPAPWAPCCHPTTPRQGCASALPGNFTKLPGAVGAGCGFTLA